MALKPPKQPAHIRVYDDLAKRTDLTWNQKAILGLLGRFQGDNPSCSTSYDVIAAATGINRRQVIRDIKAIPQSDLRRFVGKPKLEIVNEKKSMKNPPNEYVVAWRLAVARRAAHFRLDAEKTGKLIRFPSDSPSPV